MELIETREGGNQSALARSAGLDPSSVRQYLAGTKPTLEKALAIARAYQVPLGWLAGEENPPSSQMLGDLILVPRYEVRASAGNGALVVSDDVSEHMSVGREWLRRHLPPWAPPNAVVGVLEGAGDSMEPTIRDGDLLMLVRDADWKIVGRGGIFVFSLDGHLLLKRLQVMRDGSLRIISDNPAYETEVIPKAELESSGIIIHGEVFFVGGKPRSYVSAPASGPHSTMR